MELYKKNAVTVGILFLVALILNLIVSGIMDPILKSSDFLINTFLHKNIIITGNLLNFICAIAMIFIPIVFYPVAANFNKLLAQSYIVFRAFEGILFIYLGIKSLTFISISEQLSQAKPEQSPLFETLGHLTRSDIQWTTILYVIIFCLGALSFYSLLYKSKLVPRAISLWGFLAALLLLSAAIIGIYGLGVFSKMPFMQAMIYFAPPIALNEFFLGFWLIFKGFNESTITNIT